MPILVRSGAIIPTRPLHLGGTIGVAARQCNELILTIYPGSDTGATEMYEDDGVSTAYYTVGHYATTTASCTRQNGTLALTLSTLGTYPELPSKRIIKLHIRGTPPLSSIAIDGKKIDLKFTRYAGKSGTWRTYDGSRASNVIHLPPLSVKKEAMTVDVSFAMVANTITESDLSAVRGMVARANAAKQILDEIRATPGAHSAKGGKLSRLAVLGDVLSYSAGNDLKSWKQEQTASAIEELDSMHMDDDDGTCRLDHVKALLKCGEYSFPSRVASDKWEIK